MLTVSLLLLLAAFVTLVMHYLGKAPLWISVLLILIVLLLARLPL